jgi:hypothetical protein
VSRPVPNYSVLICLETSLAVSYGFDAIAIERFIQTGQEDGILAFGQTLAKATQLLLQLQTP